MTSLSVSNRKSSFPSISSVVLAAGESRRFGEASKLLLKIENEPLVRRAVRACLESRVKETIVVVGHRPDEICKAISGLPVRIVENSSYTKGQSSSLKVGLRSLAASATAAIFLPADQPFVGPALLNQMIDLYTESQVTFKKGVIIVPRFRQRRGSPVLFDRLLFAELRGVTGDEGGRQILSRHREKIVELELADEKPLLDIDTPKDYNRLVKGEE